MLACDLILEVRASRSLSAAQVARLERTFLDGRSADAHDLDLLFLIDRYADRVDPSWTALFARATEVRSGSAPAAAPLARAA